MGPGPGPGWINLYPRARWRKACTPGPDPDCMGYVGPNLDPHWVGFVPQTQTQIVRGFWAQTQIQIDRGFWAQTQTQVGGGLWSMLVLVRVQKRESVQTDLHGLGPWAVWALFWAPKDANCSAV